MIKDIQYKGYAASPSDYECSDGELAMSLNMIHEDGALNPLMQPEVVMTLRQGEKVIYIHENAIFCNYIIQNTSLQKIGWRTKESAAMIPFESLTDYSGSVIAVGNTLIFATSSGMHYYLWKDGSYIDLGTELPELNASPYINTSLIDTTGICRKFGNLINDYTSNEISNLSDSEIYKRLKDGTNDKYTLSGDLQMKLYERVFSINNMFSNVLKRENYFFEPFYVRFAYRMYDGSYVKHTAPVLLAPTTWGKPLMTVTISDSYKAIYDPIYAITKLCADIIVPDGIEKWSDIITNIDVFVTEPLIDYSDSAESLLSLSKMPWKITSDNSYESPRIMTMENTRGGEYKCFWRNIPSLVESINDSGIYIYPEGKITWVDSPGEKNRKPDKMGYETVYWALDTSQYGVEITSVTGQSGAAIPTQLQGLLPADKDWTVYNVDDLPSPFFIVKLIDKSNPDAEIDLSEGSISINTFVVIQTPDINADFYFETERNDGCNYNDILTSYSSFYRVAELELKELHGEVEMKRRTLQNLHTHQTLSDIAHSINKTFSKSVFAYNNRLNLIVDKVEYMKGCSALRTQNPAWNADISISTNAIEKAYVEIYDNDQYAYVEIETDNMNIYDLAYFSFPNANAKRLVMLSKEKGVYAKAEVALKRHDFLNLSYSFNGFEPLDVKKQSISLSDFAIPAESSIRYGNIIRLSDVNNPFRFSEEYTVSLPVKEVYALSTAAKALSQGQFGQYPLYAFTSDGIWALELTSSGTYSARQPISRDVVINKDSITQIDSSVLFATDRGIMLISGSQVLCISDRINAADTFSLSSLPKPEALVKLYNTIRGSSIEDNVQQERGVQNAQDNGIRIEDIDMIPFGIFIKECKMIYDYAHQHIIVYNPEVRYAYVYSLKSQLWGMMTCNIKDNVNSYPEALAMEDNRLVDFSKEASSVSSALVVTRPIKMEQADTLKTISTVMQRGRMNSDNIMQVLYGSNDLNRWFMVWNSDNRHMGGFRGSPWKHYRVLIIRNFGKSESLYGFSLQYETRLTNRLR